MRESHKQIGRLLHGICSFILFRDAGEGAGWSNNFLKGRWEPIRDT